MGRCCQGRHFQRLARLVDHAPLGSAQHLIECFLYLDIFRGGKKHLIGAGRGNKRKIFHHDPQIVCQQGATIRAMHEMAIEFTCIIRRKFTESSQHASLFNPLSIRMIPLGHIAPFVQLLSMARQGGTAPFRRAVRTRPLWPVSHQDKVQFPGLACNPEGRVASTGILFPSCVSTADDDLSAALRNSLSILMPR